MTVSTILAAKGRDVVTMEPSASLAAAAEVLAKNRIGAVVILGADHRIVGILSERDIVRAIAERGADALGEPVSVTMTRAVSTCNEGCRAGRIPKRASKPWHEVTAIASCRSTKPPMANTRCRLKRNRK